MTDFPNDELAFGHPVNVRDMGDNGPSDVIHDLHAKYQVNKLKV